MNSGEKIAPRHSGFTVIELLVAAAITAVLAAMMLGLVTNVLNSWNRSHGALTAEAQARLVLDRLAQDLQGALYRNDGNAWLAAIVQDNNGVSGLWDAATKNQNAKPAAIDAANAVFADARFGRAGMWLSFFAPRRTNGITDTVPAAPVPVAYQIVRRLPTTTAGNTGDATPHYFLFRAEGTPDAIFAAAPGGGYKPDPTASAGPAYLTALRQPSLQYVIADNVIDFGVRLYARDASTGAPTPIYPTGNGTTVYLARSPFNASGATNRFPEIVDVMIRVLTDEGARQIALFEEGRLSGEWWTIAEAHSKVFTRRIELHPSPL